MKVAEGEEEPGRPHGQAAIEKSKKTKGQKNFDLPERGFEPRIFEQNFPAQDLNFEGDVLQEVEERLFCIREMSRKYKVSPNNLLDLSIDLFLYTTVQKEKCGSRS